MLKQRMLTAAILIPIVLAVLFFTSSAVFCILAAGFMLAAGAEWTNIMGLKFIVFRCLYVFILLFLMYGVLFIPIKLVLILSVIFWIMTIPLIMIYPRGSSLWGNPVVIGLMGIMVIVPCWTAICVIHYQRDGAYMLLFLFLLIWGADTAAYFMGRKWGKNKLAPKVSPGKTIEGFLSAIIFSSLLAVILFYFAGINSRLWIWGLILSVVTVLFSVVGDLFESMLKRQVNLKDSGNLLPGHGGLLDRIDSLTAAAPIFATGAYLIGYYFH